MSVSDHHLMSPGQITSMSRNENACSLRHRPPLIRHSLRIWQTTNRANRHAASGSPSHTKRHASGCTARRSQVRRIRTSSATSTVRTPYPSGPAHPLRSMPVPPDGDTGRRWHAPSAGLRPSRRPSAEGATRSTSAIWFANCSRSASTSPKHEKRRANPLRDEDGPARNRHAHYHG